MFRNRYSFLEQSSSKKAFLNESFAKKSHVFNTTFFSFWRFYAFFLFGGRWFLGFFVKIPDVSKHGNIGFCLTQPAINQRRTIVRKVADTVKNLFIKIIKKT